ncbi:hypothetical protein LEP1GSC132_1251 [Leptospira kirschneri str. 200803703]|uniref:Uncharacterized protein n=1 Tax=Leptospira kirschneri str. 200802841 TaxID=1193047 RepID=A0A828Y4K0_9LEPT|nr:hypothetical protein LEP1GSC044_1195 [Leptospira kirschneri serovar Grippotyphosa str. RM52]EKO52520.1 hypothetical protein LEP1GSC131_4376 [Leptospira kirschneri str. 200802841]EKQ83047.1 hypothetical protein LEP1GSC064_3232 [Leptospira kirschneri serovar Grippotyphosa str. Moskva]EKR09596.1 hypothetical protein LEP1GSC122_1783 [Leptospira kirschneri serovar Valbuzzi str. 200702274]EMJ95853.1 hypothetical protein LEP1GSC198_2834 [Leptospira kirschneri str. JB]EMK02671.1 hypothetical protei
MKRFHPFLLLLERMKMVPENEWAILQRRREILKKLYLT